MTSAAAALAPHDVVPFCARRAYAVTWAQRASAKVFGSPSARMANGGTGAAGIASLARSRAWRERCARTPVFEVDRKGPEASERLPRIWVSEPAFDARTGSYVGREFTGVYPCDPDKGGWRALELAERYIGEARRCDGSQASALRVECFRAAEILCLHAAQRGNVDAFVRLADIYLGDLCEGTYWKGLLEHRARHAANVSLRERALAWLSQAAAQGSAEACCKLADELAADPSQPRGCKRAAALYHRAYGEAVHKGARMLPWAGVAALRLGRMHEMGCGCPQSFEVAQSWYRIASEALGEAVDGGAWRYKREASDALLGVRRMAQEISGLC